MTGHQCQSSASGSAEVPDTRHDHGVSSLELIDWKHLERRVFGGNGPELVVA